MALIMKKMMKELRALIRMILRKEKMMSSMEILKALLIEVHLQETQKKSKLVMKLLMKRSRNSLQKMRRLRKGKSLVLSFLETIRSEQEVKLI